MPFIVAQIVSLTVKHAARLFLKDELGKTRVKQEWANEVLSALKVKVDVSGVAPLGRTSILVGNHVSYLDIPVIFSFFPTAVFIAKADLRSWPILGACIAAGGTIFVSRKKNADRSLSRSQIENFLNQKTGTSVVVFPSGTTQLEEQKVWKKGIFEIAEKNKIPVQLFRLDYHPLRTLAYIDDDHFLTHLQQLAKVPNKRAHLHWLETFMDIQEAPAFAEKLRVRVRS